MAKTEKYDSVEAFTKKIGDYYDFIKDLNSKKLHLPITITFNPEIKSPGRETRYEIPADAKYGPSTFAQYYDNPLRIHDNLEDGELNLDEETTDFRNYILGVLQKKEIPAKLSGLEISITTENQ
jgi:hypothetical protein